MRSPPVSCLTSPSEKRFPSHLDRRDKAHAIEVCEVVAHGFSVLHEEGAHVRGLRIGSQQTVARIQKTALPIATAAVEEKKAVFICDPSQGIAKSSLEKVDQAARPSVSFRAGFEPRGGVILAVCGHRPPHNAPQKPIPGRAGCLGIVGNGERLGNEIVPAMGSEFAGTKVESPVCTIQEPGVSVEFLRLHRDAELRLGTFDQGFELRRAQEL